MLNSINLLIPVALIALSVAYNRTRKPAGSPVAGPSLHLGTRLLMFIQLHFFYTVPEFTEFWCKRYGDIVGLWMNGEYTIATCDAEFVQKILSGTDSKNFITRMGNDDGLKAIGMYQKGIIWNNDVSRWTLQRRIFQSGLASKVRERASVVAAESARQEISRIQTNARDSVPTVDLLNVLRHTTLAVILDVAFGIEMDREKSRDLIDSIVEYFKAWEFFLLKPRFIWPLFPLHYFRHRKAVLRLQELIKNLIPTLDQQATPFLQQLFSNNLSQQEIVQCILEMILAGTDTSSVTMYYTFLLLTENEKVQHQLLDSQESQESQDDSFLEAVLREGMRLMPVGPVIIRKTQADCNISGISILEGTNIVINLARMNRHEKWFDDPLKFKPQRFQENEDLIALSAPTGGPGPKSCVGQHLAMVEMKPVLRELLKTFKFTRINNDKPIIEMKTKWDIALQPVHNEFLKALPRKNIIFVGAHSVGKTTLARVIVDRLNAVLINETARTVMKELGIDADTIRNNPEKSLELQREIIKFQCKREMEIKYEFAVSDRSAIDAIVYARKFCGERWKELLDLPETSQCMERYRQHDKYLVFMIEPHEACLVNDGTRMMPKDYDEWLEFSDDFKKVMNECNVKYRVLKELDIGVRFSTVFQALFEN